ncbi:putative vhs domain protein [Erysiphe neolycopersici]|uniref:Putative vhs domain protein n=1 Tax=Erysiphe neolycopersici TaxID=212602 RepID=A0A420I6B3_9PEZI|nr:putative vhs domain protein [Erysiphe neolycopersici]
MPNSNYYVQRKCWSLFKSWSKFKYTNGLIDLAYLYQGVNQNDLLSVPINYQIPDEVDRKFCTLVNGKSRNSYLGSSKNSSSLKVSIDSDKPKEQGPSNFVLDDHREAIKIRIALSVMHSVNLMNALKEFNGANGPTYISEAHNESNKKEAIKKFKKDEAQIKILEREALNNKNRGEGLNQYDRAQALARHHKAEASNKCKKDEAHIELIRTINYRAKNCREFRGMILDYTDKITSSEWLGPLLFVNELLISALKMYKSIIQPVGAEFNFNEKEEEDVTPQKDKQRENQIASKKIGLSFANPSQNEAERQKASQKCDTTQISQDDENNPFVKFAGIGPFVEMSPSHIPFRTRSQLSTSDDFFSVTDPFCDNTYPLSNNPFSSK